MNCDVALHTIEDNYTSDISCLEADAMSRGEYPFLRRHVSTCIRDHIGIIRKGFDFVMGYVDVWFYLYQAYLAINEILYVYIC